MTTVAIAESGMTFGPYPAGRCFHIEHSNCYALIQEGVRMAEFLLLRQQQQGSAIWIVEAKTTCPRDLSKYMEEICTKLTNAFLLGLAACLGRHPAARDELPDLFRTLDHSSIQFRFALVVKDAPEDHLPILQEALANKMRSVVKTWALSPTPTIVLNEASAQRYGLILPTAPAG